MISVEHISKSFGSHILFSDLSMKVDDGDFLILKGASGCGKTTLLNMIGGLEPVTTGHIFLDDKDISLSKNQLWLYGERLGFLFQNFALVEHKTVRENLSMIKPRFRSNVTIEKALELVGLPDKENHKVYTLSGGEQQRVALARLICKRCDVILADEPTGSLDRTNADNIISILKDLNQNGKTVIMVTHDPRYQTIGNRYIELDAPIPTV